MKQLRIISAFASAAMVGLVLFYNHTHVPFSTETQTFMQSVCLFGFLIGAILSIFSTIPGLIQLREISAGSFLTGFLAWFYCGPMKFPGFHDTTGILLLIAAVIAGACKVIVELAEFFREPEYGDHS